jgi:hypothetical protein
MVAAEQERLLAAAGGAAYSCSKLKLDNLFLQWFSLPESQRMVRTPPRRRRARARGGAAAAARARGRRIASPSRRVLTDSSAAAARRSCSS